LPAFTPRDTLLIMATSNQHDTPEVRVSPPAWLEDAAHTALLLSRLVEDPAIQAALILRGKELWAQAGELLEQAGPELAQKVFQYWSTDGSRDLTRYVRLVSVPGEYILYATSLTDEMVLAILYNEATPFSKMRIQAAELAHTLLSSTLEEETGKWIQEYPEGAQEENPALEAAITNLPPLFEDVPPPTVSTTPASGGGATALPASSQPSPAISPYEPLGTSNQAGPAVTPQPTKPQPVAAPPSPSERPAMDLVQETQQRTAPATAQTPTPQQNPLNPDEGPAQTFVSPLDERVAMPAGLLGAAPISRPAPSFAPEPASISSYLPGASPGLSDLYLAVVLLPRLPKHHLTGDLAVLMPQWVAQVCVAYGWRLEALRVRPDYIEWVVNIPPTTSASQHLRLMRRQTSQYIFAEFPTLARENPSGDFWASGYLVTSSSQLPEDGAVQNFINQVRRQQGVSKPLPDQA
jgi:REP element-mobilizing transposase RayT